MPDTPPPVLPLPVPRPPVVGVDPDAPPADLGPLLDLLLSLAGKGGAA